MKTLSTKLAVYRGEDEALQNMEKDTFLHVADIEAEGQGCRTARCGKADPSSQT